jgi:hypothetical protein
MITELVGFSLIRSDQQDDLTAIMRSDEPTSTSTGARRVPQTPHEVAAILEAGAPEL